MARRSLRDRSAAAASYTARRRSVPRPARRPADRRPRRCMHLVLGRQLRQHRHQSLVQRRRVEVGQQHHQRAAPDPPLDRGNHRGGVGLDRARAAAGPSRRPAGPAARCGTRLNTGPRHPVVGEEVDVVTGPGGQRRQQQCGVHRPVQPRPAAGSAAVGSTPTRPADVRPVSRTSTTRRSRSGRHVRTTTSARRAVARQSIDRTSSPIDVLTQRVELGALTADQHAAAARRARAASPAATAGACATGTAAGSGPARAPVRALPAGQAERTDRAHGHHRRLLVAAPGRPQPGVDADSVARPQARPDGCAARPARCGAHASRT